MKWKLSFCEQFVDMLVEIDRMEWMGLQEVESDWEF